MRCSARTCGATWRSLARTAGISYASLTASGASGADTALPNRHGMTLAQQLRSRDRRVLATRRLLSRDGRRARVRRRGDADRHRRQLRRRYRAIRHRLSRSSLVAGARQRNAREHAGGHDAVGDDLELPAVDEGEAALRSIRGAHERILEHRIRARARRQATLSSPACTCRSSPFPAGRSASSRIMQYGGGEREDSFGDLLDAFFNPSDNDNTGTADGVRQSGRVVHVAVRGRRAAAARRLLRVRRRGHVDAQQPEARQLGAVRRHRIPEARANGSPRRSSSRSGRTAGTSTTSIGDGLRHEGHVIGHWGGDWRSLGDGVGARSAFARLNVATASSAAPSRRRTGSSTTRTTRAATTRPRGSSTRATAGRGSRCSSAASSRSAATCSASRTRASAPSSASSTSHSMTRRHSCFAHYAVLRRHRRGRRSRGKPRAEVIRRRRRQRARTSKPTSRRCPTRSRATRAACTSASACAASSASGSIGARIELDDLDGDLLLAVRAFDYRRHLSRAVRR